MHEGENKMCKGRNTGLRGVNNGTRAEDDNKRLRGRENGADLAEVENLNS